MQTQKNNPAPATEKVTTVNKVPVYDVRKDRAAANAVIKDCNRSKGSQFIKPSFSLTGHSYRG